MRQISIICSAAAVLATAALSGSALATSSGGMLTTSLPANGSPTDAAVTQQSLAGLASIGHRDAEPDSLGEWSVQNQSASVMYIVFYTADGSTRLGTYAIGPGAGVGQQGGDESWQQVFGAFKGPITLWGTTGAQATLTRQ